MLKILIVDDEPLIRKVLNRTLKNIGECHLVDNGKGAIYKYEEALNSGKPFDLILLDIIMKETNGLDVLIKIRTMEIVNNTPEDEKVKIIIVTGISEVDMVKKCVSKGCDSYIVKPITTNIIMDKINQIGLLARTSQK